MFYSVKIHDQIAATYKNIPREDDGAVRFDDLIEEFNVKYVDTLQWTVGVWVKFLGKGGGERIRFQYSLNPHSSDKFLFFRAIQGHSGGNIVDPLLQDSVLLPDDFAEYIYHIGNSKCTPLSKSGLIPGRKKAQKGEAVNVLRFGRS